MIDVGWREALGVIAFLKNFLTLVKMEFIALKFVVTS
jgi:hypothetical protein